MVKAGVIKPLRMTSFEEFVADVVEVDWPSVQGDDAIFPEWSVVDTSGKVAAQDTKFNSVVKSFVTVDARCTRMIAVPDSFFSSGASFSSIPFSKVRHFAVYRSVLYCFGPASHFHSAIVCMTDLPLTLLCCELI